MVKWYKDSYIDEIHETKFSFCFYHKMGMNKKISEFNNKIIGEVFNRISRIGDRKDM